MTQTQTPSICLIILSAIILSLLLIHSSSCLPLCLATGKHYHYCNREIMCVCVCPYSLLDSSRIDFFLYNGGILKFAKSKCCKLQNGEIKHLICLTCFSFPSSKENRSNAKQSALDHLSQPGPSTYISELGPCDSDHLLQGSLYYKLYLALVEG